MQELIKIVILQQRSLEHRSPLYSQGVPISTMAKAQAVYGAIYIAVKLQKAKSTVFFK